MGRRGPRPVDMKLLKANARLWYRVLHEIAYGEPGRIVYVDKEVKELPPTEEVRKLLPKLRKLDGAPGVIWFHSPVFPEPEVWSRFKDPHPRAIEEAYEALNTLEKHLRRHWLRPSPDWNDQVDGPPPTWSDSLFGRLIRAARERADDLVVAAELQHCPKGGQQSSDTKRIEFFSKVLAGLALGLAPRTATKRLSRWRPSQPEPVRLPIWAQGPKCPHCGAEEVRGFSPGTIVRCPSCDERYYTARQGRKE
jgi:hypothetical protein